MTNGREKSGPAIVAAKQANKAGEPAAEPGERRAGAKGNAGQERTLRTQGRDGAPQGLDRVRQAAKQGKETRFAALLHHVDVDRLREAFCALRRDAAPGVDGLTWRDYETDLDSKLADLCDRVHKKGGAVSPASLTSAVHSEGGRQAAALGGRRAGRQDRPEGGAGGAERDLRGAHPSNRFFEGGIL